MLLKPRLHIYLKLAPLNLSNVRLKKKKNQRRSGNKKNEFISNISGNLMKCHQTESKNPEKYNKNI